MATSEKPYILGLDLGVQSAGWAVIDLDKDGRPCGVRRLGVRCFDSGVGREPKSPAARISRRTSTAAKPGCTAGSFGVAPTVEESFPPASKSGAFARGQSANAPAAPRGPQNARCGTGQELCARA